GGWVLHRGLGRRRGSDRGRGQREGGEDGGGCAACGRGDGAGIGPRHGVLRSRGGGRGRCAAYASFRRVGALGGAVKRLVEPAPPCYTVTIPPEPVPWSQASGAARQGLTYRVVPDPMR